MPMVLQRAGDDPARRWGFVLALARPGKTVEGPAITDVVRPVPRQYSQRLRGPRLPGPEGGTTCWV